MHAFLPLAFFGVGTPELLVIGAVAVALFGPRLLRLLGSLWRTVTLFKDEVRDAKDQVRRELFDALDPPEPRPRRRPPKRPA